MINIHHTINLKVELIRALEVSERMKGRTNISKHTYRNWAYHVNMLLHPKRENNQVRITY
jgi:hypothetical protein